MRRNDYDDSFDSHFASTRRTVGLGVAMVLFIQLLWAVGCLAILGGFLWFMGRLGGAW